MFLWVLWKWALSIFKTHAWHLLSRWVFIFEAFWVFILVWVSLYHPLGIITKAGGSEMIEHDTMLYPGVEKAASLLPYPVNCCFYFWNSETFKLPQIAQLCSSPLWQTSSPSGWARRGPKVPVMHTPCTSRCSWRWTEYLLVFPLELLM